MFSSRFGVGLRQSRSSPLAQTHARLRPRGKREDLPRASRIGDDMADIAAAILTGDLRRRTATRAMLAIDRWKLLSRNRRDLRSHLESRLRSHEMSLFLEVGREPRR